MTTFSDAWQVRHDEGGTAGTTWPGTTPPWPVRALEVGNINYIIKNPAANRFGYRLTPVSYQRLLYSLGSTCRINCERNEAVLMIDSIGGEIDFAVACDWPGSDSGLQRRCCGS